MRLFAAALLSAALLAGCGSDTKVKEGEAASALEKLDLEIQYRDIPEPDGIDEIVAGRASRNGVSVDFSILVGEAAATTDRAPVVPYVGFSLGPGFGNVMIMTSSREEVARDHATLRAAGRIKLDIESAICDLVPDTPCAGA